MNWTADANAIFAKYYAAYPEVEKMVMGVPKSFTRSDRDEMFDHVRAGHEVERRQNNTYALCSCNTGWRAV